MLSLATLKWNKLNTHFEDSLSFVFIYELVCFLYFELAFIHCVIFLGKISWTAQHQNNLLPYMRMYLIFKVDKWAESMTLWRIESVQHLTIQNSVDLVFDCKLKIYKRALSNVKFTNSKCSLHSFAHWQHQQLRFIQVCKMVLNTSTKLINQQMK